GLHIFAVAQRAALAGMRFDEHVVACFAQRRNAARHQPYARLVVFHFLGYADDHEASGHRLTPLRRGARAKRRFISPRSRRRERLDFSPIGQCIRCECAGSNSEHERRESESPAPTGAYFFFTPRVVTLVVGVPLSRSWMWMIDAAAMHCTEKCLSSMSGFSLGMLLSLPRVPSAFAAARRTPQLSSVTAHSRRVRAYGSGSLSSDAAAAARPPAPLSLNASLATGKPIAAGPRNVPVTSSAPIQNRICGWRSLCLASRMAPVTMLGPVFTLPARTPLMTS